MPPVKVDSSALLIHEAFEFLERSFLHVGSYKCIRIEFHSERCSSVSKFAYFLGIALQNTATTCNLLGVCLLVNALAVL